MAETGKAAVAVRGTRYLRVLFVQAACVVLIRPSTIARAHQQAASGKGGLKIRRWGVPEAD